MANSSRTHAVERVSRLLGENGWIYILASLALVLNLISLCGSAYTVFAAWKSVSWHGGENLANLALLIVGLPVLFVQVVVFLPLTRLCVRSLASSALKSRTNWLKNVAILLPAVTLTAILAGVMMTE
jgi:hypothetical protein